MNTSLLFGDIFSFNDKNYIFLAKTENEVFAAEILSIKLSSQIENRYKQICWQNSTIKENNVLYCYVVLRTEEYKDRLAHLGLANKNNIDFDKLINKLTITLDIKDKKEILNEIKQARAIPLGLKEVVKDILV